MVSCSRCAIECAIFISIEAESEPGEGEFYFGVERKGNTVISNLINKTCFVDLTQ